MQDRQLAREGSKVVGIAYSKKRGRNPEKAEFRVSLEVRIVRPGPLKARSKAGFREASSAGH